MVARYLEERPATAERIGSYVAQREALRSALAWRAAEPIPPSLNVARLLEAGLARRRAPWRVAAAVLLALGLGGSGGWFLRAAVGPSVSSGLTELAREAVASHLVYAADLRRPVELWAAQRDDLARWLSNRLNRPVAPPDLSAVGYKLMGGRLVATERGPAGLFMYDNDQGKRLSIFVRPLDVGQTTEIVQTEIGNIDGFAWVSKGVGYTVIGSDSGPELRRVSQQAKQQIEGAA
jgi:anti-sigma factor RsiW